jgi:hypothetical protein
MTIPRWASGRSYYFSFNIFAGGSAFSGGMGCAYDRADMLTGAAAKAAQCFGPKANDGGLLPSDLTGTTLPPGGSPNYYVDLQSTSLNLWRFHVDWNTPANSTFTGPTSLPVASYSALCSGGTCVPQPGTSQQLDSLADRLMYRLGYRNMGTYESLVVNHSVAANGGGGVRWYEIRSPGGTPSVFQQGTFAPDASYRWMGSISMDHVGNIAAGYSISDGLGLAGFAGRLVGDPAGSSRRASTMIPAAASPNVFALGRLLEHEHRPDRRLRSVHQRVLREQWRQLPWQTRVGNFKFSSCSTTVTPDFSMSASPGSVSVVQGNSGTSTISTTVSNGFNSALSLSASGQPAGVTVSFNPTSIAAPGSGSSTMTMAVGASTATGTYPITVTLTGGGVTHTASVSLTVTAAGALIAAYDATLKAPKRTTLGSSPGDSGTRFSGRGLGPSRTSPTRSTARAPMAPRAHSIPTSRPAEGLHDGRQQFAPKAGHRAGDRLGVFVLQLRPSRPLLRSQRELSGVDADRTINPTVAGSQVLS